jgi:hypothetical protein
MAKGVYHHKVHMVLQSSRTPILLLGNHPNLRTRGRTYTSPVTGGYTHNHTQFQEQNSLWARKASAAGNIKDVVAVKVFMGRITPGQSRITMIDVSVESTKSTIKCATNHFVLRIASKALTT